MMDLGKVIGYSLLYEAEKKKQEMSRREAISKGKQAKEMWQRGINWIRAAQAGGTKATDSDIEAAENILSAAGRRLSKLPGLSSKIQASKREAFKRIGGFSDSRSKKLAELRRGARALRSAGEKATLKNLSKHFPGHDQATLKKVQDFFQRKGFLTKGLNVRAEWKKKGEQQQEWEEFDPLTVIQEGYDPADVASLLFDNVVGYPLQEEEE